ncbi:MAG: molybdopterin molybdotransferase [Planctomycetota bacterium]|jgi:molybdopterin molybdotransferase
MNRCDNDELLAYGEALAQLTAAISPTVEVIEQPLMQAQGSVLAQPIVATINVPGLAMSSMDGYAINSLDLPAEGDCELPVSQRIAAGSTGTALAPGSAARIFTGAPVPAGANAVIMQEQVVVQGNNIQFSQRPAPGQNIRPVGNDIKQGTEILCRGQRLRAQDIGLAASIGMINLPVFEPIKVGIFFTGDELVEPGQPLAAGKIYDSNRYTLHGLLSSMGCEIIDLGLVGDTLEATKVAMLSACDQADLVVTTGGVSVGEEDHVRIAIEQLGELRLWRLGVKPGKPLAYGQIGQRSFIGLPGNPVSVFVNFCLFVSPVIQILQGRNWKKPLATPVIAGFDWPKLDSRREFLRARLEASADGQTIAVIYPNQDSGVLTSTVWAEGFVEVAENSTVSRGDTVEYLSFSQFIS